MEKSSHKKQRRGFAAMSAEKQRAISQRGGRAKQQKDRDMAAKLAAIETLLKQQTQPQTKAA